MRKIRLLFRLLLLIATLALAALDYLLTIKLLGRESSLRARAVWMRRQAKNLLRVLGIETTFLGTPPSGGVLVSNHLSYTDILVYGSHAPSIFISKADVAGWPVFGLLSKCAGTLFVRREVRSDVVRLASEMPRVVDAGLLLTFFPEGTSTGGDHVLPFHASLFAPAVEHQWQITPAFLRYELDDGDGSVADEIAYWRDMVFGPHLLNLLSKKRIRAIVQYGSPRLPGSDRKTLAETLHSQVCALGGLDAKP